MNPTTLSSQQKIDSAEKKETIFTTSEIYFQSSAVEDKWNRPKLLSLIQLWLLNLQQFLFIWSVSFIYQVISRYLHLFLLFAFYFVCTVTIVCMDSRSQSLQVLLSFWVRGMVNIFTQSRSENKDLQKQYGPCSPKHIYVLIKEMEIKLKINDKNGSFHVLLRLIHFPQRNNRWTAHQV